jgi:hypothetical protein
MNDRLRRAKNPRPGINGTENLPSIAHRPSLVARSASSGVRHTTAQKRETGKNYIGLLHEETVAPCVADISAAAKHPIMDHIVGLMAAVFSRRSEARW